MKRIDLLSSSSVSCNRFTRFISQILELHAIRSSPCSTRSFSPSRSRTRFSSNAGATARQAYEGLLALAQQHPNAHSFQAFCIYITWQQVTEETIARHFETGVKLCEAYLMSHAPLSERDIEQIEELYDSFKAGLGLEEQDELQIEYKRDTPKGGD
jgi:hypothetical protein